jgi:methionyl-tRNA formyltransferase
MGLRVVFAGTPKFAIPSLQALIESHHVCAVYTKPDTPSGRGRKLTYSPVKQLILDHYPSLPILQPISFKEAETRQQLRDIEADVMVVIAYGFILPKAIFPFFKYGCINVHASLLPRWRGAAPIQRALLAGDQETGITTMQINEGLDTGDILDQDVYRIKPKETTAQVYAELAQLGKKTLIRTLMRMEAQTLQPRAQDDKLVTYAARISKEEGLIDWNQSASHIGNQIRAFNPWPVSYTYLEDQPLRILEAEIIPMDTPYLPGLVIAAHLEGIDVATQQGAIRLLTLQIPGGKVMPSRAFLHARRQLIVPKKTLLGKRLC